jgi:hypothetical protein
LFAKPNQISKWFDLKSVKRKVCYFTSKDFLKCFEISKSVSTRFTKKGCVWFYKAKFFKRICFQTCINFNQVLKFFDLKTAKWKVCFVLKKQKLF